MLHVLCKTKYFEMCINISRKCEQNNFSIYLIDKYGMHTCQTQLKTKYIYFKYHSLEKNKYYDNMQIQKF